MPKAEPGTTKFANKQLKLKGLQRLRWYCQVCQRQMRDENGFKQHTQSEGHVRAMMVVGEDPKKWIEEYSQQFQKNFLQLLRTSHGEKPVQVNRFYQEYISDKSHVHLNSTRWPSLSEFAKYLGREGICRVEEKEDGVFIQWIDSSPDAIRRREALLKADRRQDEEAVEQKEIEMQAERAHQHASAAAESDKPSELSKEKWTDFGINLKSNGSAPEESSSKSTPEPPVQARPDKPVKKPNVFAKERKRSLNDKPPPANEPPKKMSEVERIMKEDMERKNKRRRV